MKNNLLLSLATAAALSVMPLSACAQYPVLIHSHNDYTRTMPFYEAYSQHVYSLECDMHCVGGRLLVGHDAKDLRPDLTFERLYLQPLVNVYNLNGGRPYAGEEGRLQLMVEIKSDDTEAYMKAFVAKIKKHPQVFDPARNPYACRIVVTGHVPRPEQFAHYPAYVTFDGDITLDYTPAQLKQVGLFSVNFGAYSHWNGKGSMLPAEKAAIEQLVAKAHALGKAIRFWGAPESVTAWNTFCHMGIDYINTDQPEACCAFFSQWDTKNYAIGTAPADTTDRHRTIRTDRLDKITRSFAGFADDKMRLDSRQPVYTPTGLNDGADKPVRNVILIIADGMGLAQPVAAEHVNGSLTLFGMRHMGLSKTAAADDYTTDSAAGGSALATGVKTCNRHIAANADGTPNVSLSEHFAALGKAVGVVTLGNVADATPAVFYAHHTERDSADAITRCLLQSPITLLAGSGMEVLAQRHDSVDIIGALQKKGFRLVRHVDDINSAEGPVVCIDEQMADAACADNLDCLAQATREAISHLQTSADSGFFLMVEQAKVDYAGHARYLPGSILETLSLDKAVAEALRFADSNGQTLVIVTADHETGGLTLVGGDNQTGSITACYFTDDHTPIAVPVFAYGPQAQRFIGVQQNTDICHRIKEACSVTLAK